MEIWRNKASIVVASTAIAVGNFACGGEETNPENPPKTTTTKQNPERPKVAAPQSFNTVAAVDSIQAGQDIFKNGYRIVRYKISPKEKKLTLQGTVEFCNPNGALFIDQVYRWRSSSYRDVQGGELKTRYQERIDRTVSLGHVICDDLIIERDEHTPAQKKPKNLS
jgi:hypothetical protein